MRARILAPMLIVLLSGVVACAGAPTGDTDANEGEPEAQEGATTEGGPDAPQAAAAGGEAPAPQAPATYAGTLPCASCPGIEWTLTLLEDGTYRLRQVYLEADDANRPVVELGPWDTGGANDRIVLRGRSDGPIQLAVLDAETLRLLDQQGQPIESQLPYELRRLPELDRIDDVFAMTGEFSYMADAGRFTPCGTRASLPVAQEADNAALEQAYGEARDEPGSPVLVSFEGRFAMRSPMEGDGNQEVVIVETFGEARPGERCEGAVDPAPLAGTYWRLRELPGEEDYTVDPDLDAHLMLDEEAGQASGSSGCNRFTGTLTLDGDALSFGPLAGTRMACPEPAMDLESRFYAAMGAVSGYAIDGEVLTLSGPDGSLARFVRYLE